MESIEKKLFEWFLTKYKRGVILGVGNQLRHDDSVGLEVLKQLKKKITLKTILMIEGGQIPENFIEPIVEFNPSHILIIDAALLGSKSGSVKLIDYTKIIGTPISTHTLPIQIFCSYLLKMTKASIRLLLIQPHIIDFGEGLSPILHRTLKKITDMLVRILLYNK